MLGGRAGVGEGAIAGAYRRGRAERDGGRVGVRGDGLAVGGERRASVIGRACEACSSRSDSAVWGSRSVSAASRISLGATGAGGWGWTRQASAIASCDVDVDVGTSGRCGVLGLLAFLVAVGDLLADALLVAARLGERLGVLERA